MSIAPGYVTFPRGFEPANLPNPKWRGLALSTFQSRGDANPRPEETPKFCPKHRDLALPLSGICDECE
jgi:hypothetical protein